MSKYDFDLLLRAGRLVCPATRIDGPGVVAVRNGRIVAAGPEVQGTAERSFDFRESTLLPGLIDLHAHPAREGSKFGVDPDAEFLSHGVTTVLSQGDAGALNWRRYRVTTIDRSRTRVRLAINLAAPGESMPGGCFENLDDVDVEACVAAVEDGGDLIWGVAANISELVSGATDPRELMRRALEAAERTRRPLLFGLRQPADWPLEEQLALLRPGDVVTYCFRSEPCGIVQNGRIHPAVHEARRRGVLFDVGHGMRSFDFAVAEAALAEGFAPDTISTDRHIRHAGANPPHTLPRTMSKLLAAGMAEGAVLEAVTSRPARVLGLEAEIGTLATSACADLVVLHFSNEAAPLVDALGMQRPGGCWESQLTVRAGQVVPAVSE